MAGCLGGCPACDGPGVAPMRGYIGPDGGGARAEFRNILWISRPTGHIQWMGVDSGAQAWAGLCDTQNHGDFDTPCVFPSSD